ncbi:MAG: hypothetical protein NVSMB29_00010 [Candidatus Dormibacteria bacterium]
MSRNSVRVSIWALLGAANAVGAFALYWNNGGAVHFLLHAFVGSTAGFSLLLLWRGLGHPPRSGELWLPYGLSAYAMVPDIIYKFGPYHRDWMDVFLGHVSADELRSTVTPALALVLSGLLAVYAAVNRQQRALLATLRPIWIERPWGRLCVRTSGHGPAVLLVHGLGGSGRYWEPLAGHLAGSHTVIAPDLGGFGASSKPHLTYDLDFHLANLDAAVAQAAVNGQVAVVGHSFGGTLAALWASQSPQRVASLALVAAPYPDGSDATRDTLLHDRLTRAMARGNALAYGVHMLMQAMATVIVPLLRSPSMSRAVMTDYMRHTIPSYVGSLRSVLLGPDITPLLAPLRAPILLLYGTRDREVLPTSGERYRGALGGGDLHLVDGDHQLLLAMNFAPLRSWLPGAVAVDSTDRAQLPT